MRNPVRKKLMVGGIFTLVVLCGSMVYSHCQIPCGIYGDSTRFDILGEHITTVEKSMKQIDELSAAKQPNMNQVVRWVENKERHAGEIQEIVTRYFMTQRIKPVDPGNQEARAGYVKKLTLLHKLLIQAMKAKQGTDQVVVGKMRSLLNQFSEAYLGHPVK